MSRYDSPQGGNSEFEPGSNDQVLRNYRGLTSVDAAELAETELLSIAYIDSIRQVGPETQFSADFIKHMHRHWLSSLYPMAGKYRTVNVSKNGIA